MFPLSIRGMSRRARGITSIADLFAAGELGCWFDPSDFTTMFQDSGATTPVTAPGQPVGRINDKSGRGLNATQATALNRPTLQQDASLNYYLDFDGVQSRMLAGTLNFAAVGVVTVWAGFRKGSDAGEGRILDCLSTNQGFVLAAPAGASATVSASSGGTSLATATSAASFAAPISLVASVSAAIATDTLELRLNAVSAATSAADQGTGFYGSRTPRLGAINTGGSLFFSGRLYSLVVRGATTTAADILRVEQLVGLKTGIIL